MPVALARAGDRATCVWTVVDTSGSERRLRSPDGAAPGLARGGICRVALPLAELGVGAYRLRAEVRAGGRTVTREAAFRIDR
ncbi:MAG: hypothetical protein H0X44_03800 [Acidobacteria bacterium]|nr:hypothetical protein [Acidobacteriota bacterium]